MLAAIAMKGEEVVPASLILDGTLGGAGHSREVLSRFPDVKLVACDRDLAAIKRAKASLEEYKDRVLLLHSNFSDISKALSISESQEFIKGLGEDLLFDRILLDLGVSSDQLDSLERGFSYKGDAPLDMRMDTSQDLTAADIVNEFSKSELISMFRRGGVGSESVFLANQILKKRPIENNAELSAICEQVYLENARRKSKDRRGKSHAATVPFQAIRIEVNSELEALEKFLESVPKLLAPGGVLAVISFHSLEDKFVTRKMREWSRLSPEQYRLPFPTETEFGKLLSKKAIIPSDEECEKNPRSKSAKMRVFMRSNEQE